MALRDLLNGFLMPNFRLVGGRVFVSGVMRNTRWVISVKFAIIVLRVLLVRENAEDLEFFEDTGEQLGQPVECQQATVEVVAKLSLNSVMGLTNPSTIKVRGTIGDQNVVLINCGAAHNFIAQWLVNILQLSMIETPNYGVIMGSGEAVKGKGVCKSVKLNLSVITVTENFLPLEMGGVYVILGVQWLHTLGGTEVDWQNLTTKITQRATNIILKGDRTYLSLE